MEDTKIIPVGEVFNKKTIPCNWVECPNCGSYNLFGKSKRLALIPKYAKYEAIAAQDITEEFKPDIFIYCKDCKKEIGFRFIHRDIIPA